jgi:DNA (cytosine-5)-methyltransferase 1
VGRVANGVSNRVDRIKGLGNSIVPQVAFEIFKAIEKISRNSLEL